MISPQPGVQTLLLSLIRENPMNPRTVFDAESLKELAESISELGVLEPLLVTPAPDGGFHVVAGERRRRAAALAGLESVPVIVRQLDTKMQLEVMLTENLQRADLDPAAEARAIKRLLAECGMKQTELGQRIGKSQPWIANRLRLLKLPEPVLQLLAERKLTASHAEVLLKFPELPKAVLATAEGIVRDNLPVESVERAVIRSLTADEARALRPYAPPNNPQVIFFDTKSCLKCCPSCRKLDYDHACVNPVCWDQKQAEGKVAAASKTSPSGVRSAESYGESGKDYVDDYHFQSLKDPACESCEKRKLIGEVVGRYQRLICTDPRCFRSKVNAQGRAVRKAGKERLAGLIARVKEAAESASVRLDSKQAALLLIGCLRANEGVAYLLADDGNLIHDSIRWPKAKAFVKERLGLEWPDWHWRERLSPKRHAFAVELAKRPVNELLATALEWTLLSAYHELRPALDLVGLEPPPEEPEPTADKPAAPQEDRGDEDSWPDRDESETPEDEDREPICPQHCADPANCVDGSGESYWNEDHGCAYAGEKCRIDPEWNRLRAPEEMRRP